MSKSNAFETSLLGLLFNNTDIANIGDAAGLQNSAAAGSLYLALHTADPGEAGDQTTNECTYGSYARVAVARLRRRRRYAFSTKAGAASRIIFLSSIIKPPPRRIRRC